MRKFPIGIQTFFFFFKQKTAFEIHSGDWSSDVCSSDLKRNLNFNWRLVMAPPEILDYVVVHELCHLQQMNHSAAFWSLVEGILPDYKQRRDWLKTCGLIERYQ